MPRKARTHSKNEIYHIMLRAVNKQQIFYDEEDFQHFIELLNYYKEKCSYSLYAYCLMGNHVHLLIGAVKEPLEIIFRRVGSSFVYWYNAKYGRTGHLFQDRYRSEPVDSTQYFLKVLRYILQNPVAAGICESIEKYNYSSSREYLLSEPGITDTGLAHEILPENELKEFLVTYNNDSCMDLNEFTPKRCTDAKAKELILSEFGTFYPEVGQKKNRTALNDSIRKLISKGISIRQLSRLTGISKKVVESAAKISF